MRKVLTFMQTEFGGKSNLAKPPVMPDPNGIEDTMDSHWVKMAVFYKVSPQTVNQ